jgi:hypothetical protein
VCRMARRSHRAEISVNDRARTAGTPPVRGSRESPNEKGRQQCHQPLVGLILSSKSPISVRSIGRPPSYDKRLNQIFRWVVRSGGRRLVAAFGQALKDQRALSTKSVRDFGMARDEGSGCEQTAETYQFLRDYLDRRGERAAAVPGTISWRRKDLELGVRSGIGSSIAAPVHHDPWMARNLPAGLTRRRLRQPG